MCVCVRALERLGIQSPHHASSRPKMMCCDHVLTFSSCFAAADLNISLFPFIIVCCLSFSRFSDEFWVHLAEHGVMLRSVIPLLHYFMDSMIDKPEASALAATCYCVSHPSLHPSVSLAGQHTCIIAIQPQISTRFHGSNRHVESIAEVRQSDIPPFITLSFPPLSTCNRHY